MSAGENLLGNRKTQGKRANSLSADSVYKLFFSLPRSVRHTAARLMALTGQLVLAAPLSNFLPRGTEIPP